MKIVFNRIENIKEKSNNIFIHMFRMVFYSIDLYNSEVIKNDGVTNLLIFTKKCLNIMS